MLSNQKETYSYNYFYGLLEESILEDPFSDLDDISGDGVYYSDGDVTINGVFPGGKVVVLVAGKIDIETNVTVPVGDSLVMIASGNIDVDPTVTNIQGIYFADGQFLTPASGATDIQLVGQGMFIGGNVGLSRDLMAGNSDTPAEYFQYRPDLWFNSLQDLWGAPHTWQERAP